VSRIPTFAGRYGLDLLITIAATEGLLEAAVHQDAVLEPGTTGWVAVPAVPCVVLPLLARRRVPFAAPLAVWLIATGLSSIDGKLVTSHEGSPKACKGLNRNPTSRGFRLSAAARGV
jgi:hypothetical protein